MTQLTWLIPIVTWLAANCCCCAQSALSTEFEDTVGPLLVARCVACHGSEEQNGGIRLDSSAVIKSIGDSGSKPIVPGAPEESELLKRVRSRSGDDQMPPDGDRLTTQQVSLIEQWIRAGADWPASDENDKSHDGIDQSQETRHWAFEAIRDPQPPTVPDAAWPANPIDRFIRAKQEEAGVDVVSPADPHVLVRRASYDLTGLPPSPDEVREFLAERNDPRTSMTAYANLIQRLLDRPAYGERWGRHWMDWVRYADTAGDNSDYPIPQAYLYRNYIINAFNADMPFDQFVTEQIAGDLLPAETLDERNRQVIATGYIAMARRFGSLIERYPWHLTVEDTIDNLSRTMLGVTIACARCHDHKFDPISTRDYYGLYGIFASTKYPMPGLELFKAQQNFVPLVSDEIAAKSMQPHRAEINRLESELQRTLAESQAKALENVAMENTLSIDEQRARLHQLDDLLLAARKSGEKLADFLKLIPSIPTAYAVSDGAPQDSPVQLKGEPLRPGVVVPRKFPDAIGGQVLAPDVASSFSGRLELAHWIANPMNPLTARVIVNRVWQRHFGKGLVPTTSDFGVRGDLPTHPELLDSLASDFIRSGWSIKHLHRLIMTSQTYQLASVDLPENLAIDPNNQLLWKFSRQRLDAESLRDTLLVIGGELDQAPQTQPYPFPDRKDWGFTQHHPFKDDYQSNKRSVYLMTKRLTAKPYLQTFDGPDANVCTSSRDQSVTALQALYFVNDTFLNEQAQRFATRLQSAAESDEETLVRCFFQILSRPPLPSETQLLHSYLNDARKSLAGSNKAETQAWTSVVRCLLSLNEFFYLD